MEEHGVTQTEHMATIEAHAVAQQVQQVHVATYTEHSMLSADEDSPSSPEDTSYDDSDILNSTAADEVTAHLAAAGNARGMLGVVPPMPCSYRGPKQHFFGGPGDLFTPQSWKEALRAIPCQPCCLLGCC